MLPDHLEATIKRLELAVRGHVRRHIPTAEVFSFGATHIDPKHLAVWVRTDTDAERDALLGDPAFAEEMRAVLRDVGYPEAAIPEVGFTAESEETVQRDFGGDWWKCVK